MWLSVSVLPRDSVPAAEVVPVALPVALDSCVRVAVAVALAVALPVLVALSAPPPLLGVAGPEVLGVLLGLSCPWLPVGSGLAVSVGVPELHALTVSCRLGLAAGLLLPGHRVGLPVGLWDTDTV